MITINEQQQQDVMPDTTATPGVLKKASAVGGLARRSEVIFKPGGLEQSVIGLGKAERIALEARRQAAGALLPIHGPNEPRLATLQWPSSPILHKIML